MTDPKLPATPATLPASFISWLEGKDAARLEAIEHDGRTLYPATLKRQHPRERKVIETAVMLRTPTVPERAQARIAACREVGEMAGLKTGTVAPTLEQARAHVGPVEFDNLETCEILSLCIREKDPPHGRFATGRILGQTYNVQTIAEVSDQLDRLVDAEDPRMPEVLEPKAFLAMVIAIAKAGDPGPLAVIAGRARSSFIASMAVQLASFLTSGSSPPQLATSTPEAKEPPSSSA